jgi:hypothetical protein
MLGSNAGQLRLRHWLSDALASRLYLIHFFNIMFDLFSGMTNPPYILDHLEEMVKILNHSRVYSFLHVPVQSGKLTNFFSDASDPDSLNLDSGILLNRIQALA